MKEYLHLFTDVKEALPEMNQDSYMYDDNGQRVKYAEKTHAIVFGIENNKIMVLRYGKFGWAEVGTNYMRGGVTPTHWLDISKLTTKDKAADEATKMLLQLGIEHPTFKEVLKLRL